MLPVNYYLILSAVVFAIGVVGVLIRRNLIVVLMSIELMLNPVISVRWSGRWRSFSSWR